MLRTVTGDRPTREVAEQQGLGQAGALERGQVQARLGAVRPGVRILHPGDEDLRRRFPGRVGGNERDGAARADVQGGPPPGLGPSGSAC